MRFLPGNFYSKTELGLQKGHLEASRLGPQDCSVPVPGTQTKVNWQQCWEVIGIWCEANCPPRAPHETAVATREHGGVTIPCMVVLVTWGAGHPSKQRCRGAGSQPRGLWSYSTQGCTSLHPSASFYLLIPLNIHQ